MLVSNTYKTATIYSTAAIDVQGKQVLYVFHVKGCLQADGRTKAAQMSLFKFSTVMTEAHGLTPITEGFSS